MAHTQSEGSVVGKLVKAFIAYKTTKGAMRVLAPTLAMSGIGYYLYRNLTGAVASKTASPQVH
jgi:hypothetical protein